MKRNRTDFMINGKGYNRFTISIREYIFGFIPTWVELAYASTENTPEEVIEFETMEDASNFIDSIIQQ